MKDFYRIFHIYVAYRLSDYLEEGSTGMPVAAVTTGIPGTNLRYLDLAHVRRGFFIVRPLNLSWESIFVNFFLQVVSERRKKVPPGKKKEESLTDLTGVINDPWANLGLTFFSAPSIFHPSSHSLSPCCLKDVCGTFPWHLSHSWAELSSHLGKETSSKG